MPIDLSAMTAVAAVMTGGCAEGAAGPFDVTGEAVVVSDYRYRGISLSDQSHALQGSLDIAHKSGFSGGVWASSIAPLKGATLELDLYAAYSFTAADVEFTLGATVFFFPGGEDSFGEAEASASRAVGPVNLTIGVDYAWDQHNLRDADNLYVYLRSALPLQQLTGLPLRLSGALGYENGAFAIERDKLDWSLGVALRIDQIELGAVYTGTNLNDSAGDSAIVLSVGRSF
jgi:uncharacterized protein (TIGR02001 family)